MKLSVAAAAAFAFALSAAPSFAASVDLSALGLRQGALIAQSDQASIFFDAGFDLLEATVDDGASLGFFDAFPSDPSQAFLNVVAPVSFAGFVVAGAYDIDATTAAGLFQDDLTGEYVYALLTLPAGTAFDFGADRFEIAGATAELYAVAPIPLPAALPMALAGLGALAFVGRRRAA